MTHNKAFMQIVSASALLLSATSLLAQQSSASGASAQESAARDWLELQTSGRAASPVARPMPGDIAERSYQRYAESFSQPIPEKLDREGFLDE